MFVKEDEYYNDKVEIQSSISTLYNSFDEFKESLSNSYIKAMIKDQFLKVAVLLSEFNTYKFNIKERIDKIDEFQQTILNKQ